MARTLSAEALARACLARIEERESAVGAWIHIDPDAVLAQAKKLDAGQVRGPLHGLPIAFKDMQPAVGFPCTMGSRILRAKGSRTKGS